MPQQVEANQFHQVPMPIHLRSSIRKTCKAIDESDAVYTLDQAKRASRKISLVPFFEVNVETLPAAQFYDIFSLPKGETIEFGGGAQAISTLKRIH